MKKILSQYSKIPRWYGVAYYNPARDSYVAYPIPLHIAISLWRRLSRKFKLDFVYDETDYRSGLSKDIFDLGVIAGEQRLIDRCIKYASDSGVDQNQLAKLFKLFRSPMPKAKDKC